MSLRSYQGVTPTIADSAYIDESAVVIGQVNIEQQCSIWPHVTIRGDVNSIQIGQRSNIQDGSVIHVTRPSEEIPAGLGVQIGDDVTIGHNATLHGCTLGNRILVGMGAILLDGVIVADDIMIGAGALVPPGKKLKSGYLYRGHPVTRARPLTEAEFAFLRQSAQNYIDLKDHYCV